MLMRLYYKTDIKQITTFCRIRIFIVITNTFFGHWRQNLCLSRHHCHFLRHRLKLFSFHQKFNSLKNFFSQTHLVYWLHTKTFVFVLSKCLLLDFHAKQTSPRSISSCVLTSPDCVNTTDVTGSWLLTCECTIKLTLTFDSVELTTCN